MTKFTCMVKLNSGVKKVLKLLKKLCNNANNKIETHKQKKEIFNKLKIGDMVWCIMPLPKKQLNLIEQSHRIRPYLVVYKEQNFLLCYQCSSKDRVELNNCQKYLISGKKYKTKKDSWIDLTEIIKIKIKNIESTYITLNQIDIKNIEKRIKINQYKGNSNIINFNEQIYLEIGDVVLKEDTNYFIYSEDNVNVYGFKIQKKKKDEQEFEKIIIDRKTYYTNFKEFKIISRNDNVCVINIAFTEEILEIFNKRKKLKICKEIYKELNNSQAEYEVGSTFKNGNSKVMYLYSDNQKHYGVDLLWYTINPRIFEIKNIESRKILETKNLKEINKVLEILIEKNLGGSKLKNVYNRIRKLLYTSVT